MSPFTRRRLLAASSGLAAALAGCSSGAPGRSPNVYVSNDDDETHPVGVLVRRDERQVAGGRFRLPTGVTIGLRREGFKRGPLYVAGRVGDDEWEATRWHPERCDGGPNNDVTVSVQTYNDVYVADTGCEPGVGGFGGGGGSVADDAEGPDPYRVGDVSTTPTVTPASPTG